MIQNTAKPEVNLDAWEDLMKKGITNAIAGLSQMVQKRITVDSVSISRVPAKEVIDLMGGPETLIVGIYLNFSGAANGHLMLAHRPEVAYALLGMILGEEPVKRDDLSDYEQSALGEMGNITALFSSTPSPIPWALHSIPRRPRSLSIWQGPLWALPWPRFCRNPTRSWWSTPYLLPTTRAPAAAS